MPSPSRKRNARGHVDPFYARRERYREVLRLIGLDEAFEALPRWVKENYWKNKEPEPVVEIDGLTLAAARRVQQMINDKLWEVTFTHDGVTMRVRDYFAVISGCRISVWNTNPAGLPASVLAFVEKARPVLERWQKEAHSAAVSAMLVFLANGAVANSAIDTWLPWFEADLRTLPNGKSQPVIKLHKVEPRERQITLDSGTRPTWRAARLRGGAEPQWLSWRSRQLGRIGDDVELPVYVQRHAILNLNERVNLQAAGPFLQLWLGESLAEPKIAQRRKDGDLLVEYRIRDYHVGYLLVEPMADCVVVKTFLFLTMEGTPQAIKLHRYLRLTRGEINWLRLNDLATFTRSDLRHDPKLRRLLTRCGCGQLFEINETTDFTPAPERAAVRMRKYLGMAA
jgi:hypothetical protein